MTMYLVLPQLKNRQIKIEHGRFYPLADDRATSRSCHFNNKKKNDTSAQTRLCNKLRVKISKKVRLKELSLHITRTISKKSFQIKFSSSVSKSA